jgi:hypothetical protein
MAFKEKLPNDLLSDISNQISDFLPGLYEPPSRQPKLVEMRESFAVWTLDLPASPKRTAPDQEFPAYDTGYWHHQILFDGKAAGHAESEMTESRSLSLHEVSISPLAKKIDDAIEWAEKKVKQPVLLRLLALPSLLIYTFWLVDLHKIYIIDAFPDFIHLQTGKLLSEKKFLSLLYKDLEAFESKRKGDRKRS